MKEEVNRKKYEIESYRSVERNSRGRERERGEEIRDLRKSLHLNTWEYILAYL